MIPFQDFRRAAAVLAVALLAVAPTHAAPQDGAQSGILRYTDATIERFRHIAVQDEGRVKPLDTLAGFTLLRLNEKRTHETESGERLTPIVWLMDCLFHPELAQGYRTFRVRTNEVLYAIGLDIPERKKADRYSYNELMPGIPKLFELARSYAHIDAKERGPVETQVVNLAQNVVSFENLIHYLDPIRATYPLRSCEELRAIYGSIEGDGLAAFLTGLAELSDLWMRIQAGGDGMPSEETVRAVEGLLRDASRQAQWAHSLALFPPVQSSEKAPRWYSIADSFDLSMLKDPSADKVVTWVSRLQDLDAVKDDLGLLEQQVASFQADLEKAAAARGQYDKIPMEVRFYKIDFFTWALVVFLLAFVVLAVSWLKPMRWQYLTACGFLLIGTLLVTSGVTMRCILRSRPPVSTLYETILFIAGCGVIVALAIEFINRKRIAIVVAALIGAGGMFLANRYEIKEGIDTMPELRAVLDTNFWLSTHVTSVTLGYAAGLLAAAIAHVYILGRFFGVRKGDTAFYKTITRMTYGVICFGLLFSVVGTILGGIWANDSWGRFWGWDPKENGALMIVLWQLFMLHSRMGGYLRDLGMNIAAVFGGVIVAFSWWGVNLLGVGLHSYGFTSGIALNLYLFYGTQLVVIILGLLLHYLKPSTASASN